MTESNNDDGGTGLAQLFDDAAIETGDDDSEAADPGWERKIQRTICREHGRDGVCRYCGEYEITNGRGLAGHLRHCSAYPPSEGETPGSGGGDGGVTEAQVEEATEIVEEMERPEAGSEVVEGGTVCLELAIGDVWTILAEEYLARGLRRRVFEEAVTRD